MPAKKAAAAPTPAPVAQPAAPVEAQEDNLVHLKTVAAEFDMDPRAVRIHLRAKGYVKPDGRWAWEEDSADLAKLRAELEAKGKEEPEAPAPAPAPAAQSVVKKKAPAAAPAK